jgi:L-ribulokinase
MAQNVIGRTNGAATYAIGLDFGTESVRALIVDVAGGRVAGRASEIYPHGVIDARLPAGGVSLPADYALQHPSDWLETAGRASRAAVGQAGVSPADVIGIGVDFTSCTMLPARRDGTPLCLLEDFAARPMAWAKLWKHHGAKAATDRMNRVARERGEPWLDRYGGTIGLEWFWAKVLETLEEDPGVFDAAEVWLEAGDWLVWQLTSSDGRGACPAGSLVRSTCQAGYKAMWSSDTGYPSGDYFRAVDPRWSNVVAERMPGRMVAPGRPAGGLSEASAELLGLAPGTPVSAAVIDAHAGVPGSGVAEPGTLVMVMGTSACHMINATTEVRVPGVAGVVREGILPGFFGYETGQASFGDALAWVARTVGRSHEDLNALAADAPPGAGGVLALDWLNGCRTPLMDGRLSGAFVGLTLGTRPEQLYRAMIEALAMGLRRIVETLRGAGVPVERFVASGGLQGKSPLLMQVVADVLNAPVALAESDESVALGAAIYGCLAAGPAASGHGSAAEAIGAMARVRADVAYQPDGARARRYDELYRLYGELAAGDGAMANVMRRLRAV